MENNFTYPKRLERLLKAKETETEKKLSKYGRTMDLDDRGRLVPPDDFDFVPTPNHKSGGFFGPASCGKNYRRLLDIHPVYCDPDSALLGTWMVMLCEYRKPMWDPKLTFKNLEKEQRMYDIVHGIGGMHHFLADYSMGLELGWKKILENIEHYSGIYPDKKDFYHGLSDCVLGIQDYIRRHADKAQEMAEKETDTGRKKNLIEMSDMSGRLVNDAPKTFHEAVQWMTWYEVTANIYNGCGSAIGDIDRILKPFYDRDKKAGILSDEDAIFYICCFLLVDNCYCQIGGCDKDGNDNTNELSFIMLEAMHKLKIPTCICVRVHENINKDLMYKAVKYLFEDRTGAPNFLGDKAVTEGFMRNGYTRDLAVTRVKCGCHWCAIPGREYTLNDVVKINFAAVYDTSFKDMMQDKKHTPSAKQLWHVFKKHLKRAVKVTARGIDFHIEHMHEVFPELLNDLFCHGPVEKGSDATHKGVEYYDLCVDGAGLATVADSFAALEQRIDKEKRLTWEQMDHVIETDYKDAEDIRLMMKNIPHFGVGGSVSDGYAKAIVETFVRYIKEKNTPDGHIMIPGLFSWANTIPMGKAVRATANGRFAGAPISHGANPVPGFKETGALTALANAVASVQCGYGNTAPIQLEINPVILKGEEGIRTMISFITTYCDQMGGTLMNINIMNKDMILDAHKDPSKYPDLIVRVTGFSAYFALLSEDFRKLVVDRIINE